MHRPLILLCLVVACDSGQESVGLVPAAPAPDTATPPPSAPPPAPPAAADACPASGFRRRVKVATPAQLTAALAGARPGDQIALAPGTYAANSLTVTGSGTGQDPITLCGPRTAILTAGSQYGMVLRGARYWRLRGFRITNSFSGLHLERSSFNIIDSLEVDNTDQEGIAIQGFSTHNTVQWTHVHDTGKRSPFGEGIYIGSDNGHWNWWTPGSLPDRSDSNQVLHTVVERSSAENIDVKEGTTGQLIQYNTFSDANGDAWVALRGNASQALDNNGIRATSSGFQVWTHPTLYPAWGHDNIFRRNHADIQPPGTIGFSIRPGQEADNLVYCDNVVINATSFSNVPCTP
jgi:hypothetical protein